MGASGGGGVGGGTGFKPSGGSGMVGSGGRMMNSNYGNPNPGMIKIIIL